MAIIYEKEDLTTDLKVKGTLAFIDLPGVLSPPPVAQLSQMWVDLSSSYRSSICNKGVAFSDMSNPVMKLN